MKNQDIYQIRQLTPDTYQIVEAGFINTYLLLGTKKALLIDTGNGAGNIREIVEQITDLPVEAVITHRHSDHIGGAGWFDHVLVPEGDMAKEYDGSSGRIYWGHDRGMVTREQVEALIKMGSEILTANAANQRLGRNRKAEDPERRVSISYNTGNLYIN